MKQTMKPKAEASLGELCAFAEQIGVEGARGVASKDAALALLDPAWPQDFILVGTVPDVVDPAQSEHAQFEAEPVGLLDVHRDPIVELTIQQSPLEGGKWPVPLAVNEDTRIVQRGVKVKLPYRFFVVLKNSSHTYMEWDENTNEIAEHEVPKFPYQIHSLPSDAEIAAWHAETRRLEEETRRRDEAARKLAA